MQKMQRFLHMKIYSCNLHWLQGKLAKWLLKNSKKSQKLSTLLNTSNLPVFRGHSVETFGVKSPRSNLILPLITSNISNAFRSPVILNNKNFFALLDMKMFMKNLKILNFINRRATIFWSCQNTLRVVMLDVRGSRNKHSCIIPLFKRRLNKKMIDFHWF